ncbi:monovalent cation:proton antiporter family protein [Ligilactobacillus saerimneri]
MTVSLLLVTIVAFFVPLLLAKFKVSILPTSVAEILVGIILGKSCLNVIHIDSSLAYLSTLGVIMLMFLSGLEIDFSLFKKNVDPSPLEQKRMAATPNTSPLLAASIAYVLSVVTSFILAMLFKVSGLFTDVALATILFATVSLGIVISLLKENELLSKKFGQAVLLFAIFGEVVPMLALTVYSSVHSGRGGSLWLISLLFILAAFLFHRFRRFFTFFDNINKSTTQLDIRLSFMVIIALVLTATGVGAENIFGAFVAGIVVKLLEPVKSTQRHLDAVGYGFLIPFFFILTGVKLDIPALMQSPTTLILIPLFFIAYVVAKLPAYFGFVRRFSKRNAAAASFLSGTTITLVLATLQVAEELHVISSQQSGAFMLAAILTCIFGPLVFNKLYRPEVEDMKKTQVSIIGANLVTVSAAQQLSKEWYDVTLFTDRDKNYSTYNSQANVQKLASTDVQCLIDNEVFDTDILLLAHLDTSTNVKLATAAKEYGVPRVICRLENREPMDTTENALLAQGIEVFDAFDTNVGMTRSMVETPSMLRFIQQEDFSIFEIEVTNAKYDGTDIKDLPGTDKLTISRIIRAGKTIAPHGNTRIRLYDHLLLTGDKNTARELQQKIGKRND